MTARRIVALVVAALLLAFVAATAWLTYTLKELR